MGNYVVVNVCAGERERGREREINVAVKTSDPPGNIASCRRASPIWGCTANKWITTAHYCQTYIATYITMDKNQLIDLLWIPSDHGLTIDCVEQ